MERSRTTSSRAGVSCSSVWRGRPRLKGSGQHLRGALRPFAAWACGLAVPVDNRVAHRNLHNPSGCAQGPQATAPPLPSSLSLLPPLPQFWDERRSIKRRLHTRGGAAWLSHSGRCSFGHAGATAVHPETPMRRGLCGCGLYPMRRRCRMWERVHHLICGRRELLWQVSQSDLTTISTRLSGSLPGHVEYLTPKW